jgi:hypothetical protein
MVNNDKNDRQQNGLPFLSLTIIVLSVIFVVIYHCVVCHFCRYLPLCCLSSLSLFTIVLSVIFVVIYHCVVCDFCRYLPLMTDNTMVNNDKNDRQHNGK